MPRPGDFTTTGRQVGILTAIALLLGVLSGVIAFALLRLIGLITNLAYDARLSTALVAPTLEHWGVATVAIPVMGGLLVGLLARYGTDKIRGHGIPEAIQAILEDGSRMQPRVAVLKPLASAITIGSGGPFGAEGPIIMTGGAVGSLVAQLFSLSSMERRTLLVAGAAAGMSATFGAPVSAVLLAVELLLFEWRPRSLVPVAAASAVAYGVRTILLGPAPLFETTSLPFTSAHLLPWSVAVGLAAGLASGLLTKAVYLLEDSYPRLHIHWMWWPAIGGLVVGLGGLVVPQALGVGYPTIRALDAGQVVLGAAVALLVVKALIWVISLSSGTSGGVLAPLLLIGGALGTVLGAVLPGHHVALWATVGMAAMLGGTMRAPFTATLFMLETTHDFGALTAAFLGSVAAMLVTVLWLPRSILTEKVARRGVHVAREYGVHPLEGVSIGQIMVPRERVRTLAFDAPAVEAAQALTLDGSEHDVYPVIGANGEVMGLVRAGAILAAALADGSRSAADLARPASTIGPADRARVGAETMARQGEHELVVVAADGAWIGIVTQEALLQAWRRGLAEEEERAPSWRLSFLRRPASASPPEVSEETSSTPA
jgi:chloride channel protein, CIC family